MRRYVKPFYCFRIRSHFSVIYITKSATPAADFGLRRGGGTLGNQLALNQVWPVGVLAQLEQVTVIESFVLKLSYRDFTKQIPLLPELHMGEMRPVFGVQDFGTNQYEHLPISIINTVFHVFSLS